MLQEVANKLQIDKERTQCCFEGGSRASNASESFQSKSESPDGDNSNNKRGQSSRPLDVNFASASKNNETPPDSKVIKSSIK